MRATRTFSAGAVSFKTLLPVAILLGGCGDLALEADRIPAELEIAPDPGLLKGGEPTKLELVVKDQHGEAMPVPSWTSPVAWTVSDDSVAGISPDGTLTGTKGGRVDVRAELIGLKEQARFRMNPDRILLTAPAIYLNQVAQNRGAGVALISGRPALLRVFVVADQANWLESPSVQVTLLHGDDVVLEQLIPPESQYIPTDIDESSLRGSYDVEVPGSIVQPGVRMVVELDPEGVVPLAPGSRTRYPAEGSKALDVVEPPVYRIILVPTISRPAPDSSVFEWTDGIDADSEQLRLGRTILPVGEMEVEVHETYTTSLNLRNFGNWLLWRNEIGLLYEQEGRRGYYYGVVGEALGGVAGWANIGYRSAWDRASTTSTRTKWDTP